jgi:aryl-alcohol dehydrogenase-like predicted oxidoreductase
VNASTRSITALPFPDPAVSDCGAINLGHAADLARDYDLARMEAHAHAVLDAAWEAGVRYFDVARSYGRAEAFLASWLVKRQISPGAVTVGSKWGYTYTAGWQAQAERHEVKDHPLPTLLRQAAESREILGPYLGLYQIHFEPGTPSLERLPN